MEATVAAVESSVEVVKPRLIYYENEPLPSAAKDLDIGDNILSERDAERHFM